MAAPYSYEFINQYNSAIDPSTVHCGNTNLTWFFRRYLLQKVFGVFKWDAPDWWNMDFFRYVLYNLGYIIIVNTDAFGTIPMMGGLRGYNVFYAPTHAVISNPLITGILEPVIDEQCVVIKLTPDYCGIFDLITYYANQMALAGEAAGMNLINSKLGYLAAAKSKTMAEAIKKAFDAIQSGNPMVVYDQSYKQTTERGDAGLLELFTQDLRQNFIAPDIQEVIRDLDDEFCRKIGLYTVNGDKKERMINAETNQDATYVTAETWLESLQKGCKAAREMFGITLDVDWRYDHEIDTVPAGPVSLGSDDT